MWVVQVAKDNDTTYRLDVALAIRMKTANIGKPHIAAYGMLQVQGHAWALGLTLHEKASAWLFQASRRLLVRLVDSSSPP
mmetsp:Transcript_24700/g.45258  ORF Transcript_24700/g.45258 Transcript_24700/m.45258 type:complete len:80 (+) Transcript_24700:1834-2073(+)